ncbi:nicotinate-nucleotide adenylyltransferase [Thalassotalea agarivorans]|uniref:Probable nicotinate-nucleotide adenylyltransferase n=1 Tax=Thalassotalea agarivorans TaxID=349064 RepID=A0A1I0I080_THASX|nr:nicotinate-nucleotide adenylyltransferase [Thalassotalea agarivorans]SET89018.1 nicotinate-nucleotide adenylyltransferase [Thalassotalea agarivorans]
MSHNNNSAIALLGGTFDPVHNGHIAMANHVADFLGLDKVSLMPAFIPPHKNSTKTSVEHRVAMLELAIKQQPRLNLDLRELSRNAPSFTVDTLKELKQAQPDRVIYFLIGMDSLLSFNTWKNYEQILTLCHLVVTTRPGFDPNKANDTVKAIIANAKATEYAQAGQIIFTPPFAADMSSTELRQAIVQGTDNSNEIPLPKAVLSYIKQHQLYQA